MTPPPGVSGAGAVAGNGTPAAAAAATPVDSPAGLTSAALLRHGGYSAGLRYTTEERAALGLTGLLPPAVESLDTQVARVMRRLADLRPGLDQYEYLASVDAADERLFYATVLTHLTRIMPLIYTPVVGAFR